VTVPFVLPTVVVGTAFLALGWDQSIWAILAAHVFFNVAVVVRTVSTLWTRIDPELQESARVLGCSERQVFTRVTLPLLRPALAAAASIVFLFTFTSFGVVLILGGFSYATLEVEIYRQAVSLFDLPLAAALAVVQLVGVSAALFGYSRYQERTAASWALDNEAERPQPRGLTRALVAVSVMEPSQCRWGCWWPGRWGRAPTGVSSSMTPSWAYRSPLPATASSMRWRPWCWPP
jgi:thiamine transport system permease protein